jgi:hypothetical protein
VESTCQEQDHHEAMKKSGFSFLGRTHEMHLAGLTQKGESALLHGFMVIRSFGKCLSLISPQY